MYRYALRAVEATKLLREDINLAARRIHITRAKHGVSNGTSSRSPLEFTFQPAYVMNCSLPIT